MKFCLLSCNVLLGVLLMACEQGIEVASGGGEVGNPLVSAVLEETGMGFKFNPSFVSAQVRTDKPKGHSPQSTLEAWDHEGNFIIALTQIDCLKSRNRRLSSGTKLGLSECAPNETDLRQPYQLCGEIIENAYLLEGWEIPGGLVQERVYNRLADTLTLITVRISDLENCDGSDNPVLKPLQTVFAAELE